ncbi:7 transmembrane receptor (rhodopsin family) domain-containing protein [Ditylenchus destructor]|uniref:7 transmembrane receptor (Rhodopsin family) domain-containing protein n=1 Tax=Ditylenchus destructor TaxID=166010 RepID=A0AAD4NKF2_9BILA|nr:7 transmembrane receptor (rhodopsin family) domain-containing protein [Ditylenchus destructor]
MEDDPNGIIFANICSIHPHAAHLLEENQEALEIVWWTNVVSLPIIAIIGLVCNAMNLLILTTNESARRMPSWHLLVALALFDGLFLLFAVMEVTPMSITALVISPLFNYLYTNVALYIRMLASTFYKASILVVVAFNLERYVCVCRPLWAHRVCTSRNNCWAIAFAMLVSFLCSIQWPLAYDVVECWDSIRVHYFSIITMKSDPIIQVYYKTMDSISLIAFNLLPIFLLSILNFQLIITLRRVVDQDNRRNSDGTTSTTSRQNNALFFFTSNESSSQRLNANAMLFAVVFLLFICIGPQGPARLLYDYYGHYHVTAILYTCISQQLVFLNASLNFCFYCLVSRRYRGLLRESLRRIFQKHKMYSPGLHIKTRMSSLLSPPSTVIGVEEHPLIERRGSAPPLSLCDNVQNSCLDVK